jgi:uncharacterized membrane protein
VELLLVVVFFMHYAAPLTGTIFVVIMQGMRHLRRWKCRGRIIGIWITRIVVATCILVAFRHFAEALAQVQYGTLTINAESSPARQAMFARARIAYQVAALEGKHLVIVQYAPGHDVHAEWVYNAADVDRAKIVWAREIPGQDLSPLLAYFRDRRVWVVEADRLPPKLEEYRHPSGDQ